MSYTALYRKLRPQSFSDVIGQPHIVKTLINQINTGRVSHAYLFCGTRGTGKTSTAKIFARAVNCYEPVDGEPCNKCSSCESILKGSSLNVIEIDAASNNGVDNIREIRDEVKYAPTEGKYRIYIIDEVHMLSTGAFNALLKTLEEPPPFVLFILATTDPQKIPATVLSRVQRFDFHRITVKVMAEKIKEHMLEENVGIDENAIYYISGLADGAMRDALSILDQCIAFHYGQHLTIEMVQDIVGSVDSSVFFSFTEALNKYDTAKCMEIIDETVIKGRDISQFVSDLIQHFRNLLISLNIQGSSSALAFSDELIEKMKKQAQEITAQPLISYISAFSSLQSEIKYASNQRVLLEIACMKICNPEARENAESPVALIERIKKLEIEIANGVQINAPVYNNVKSEVNEEPKAFIEKAIPEDIQKVIKSWDKVVNKFKTPKKGYLKKSKPCYIEGSSLIIVSPNGTTSGILRNAEGEIKDCLKEMFNKEFNIIFMAKDEYDMRHMKTYNREDDAFLKESLAERINSDIIYEE